MKNAFQNPIDLDVVCTIPLFPEACEQFISFTAKSEGKKNISSNSVRYETLDQNNILNKYQKYMLPVQESVKQYHGNIEICDAIGYLNDEDCVVMQIFFQCRLSQMSEIDTLSDLCNKQCSQYICELLLLTGETSVYPWVNRTMLADSTIVEADFTHICEKWLFEKENVLQQLRNENYIVCWGNNLILRDKFDCPTDVLDAILMMQFNYFELDNLNTQLKMQMKKIHSMKSNSYQNRNDLLNMKSDILKIKNKVEYELVQFYDEVIDIQGISKECVYKLMEVWQLNVLIESCQRKISFYQNEINSIDQELSERSSRQQDILLFAIGLFGLMSYFLDFSQVSDSLNGVGDWSHSSFPLWLFISVLLCLIAVLYYRRRR